MKKFFSTLMVLFLFTSNLSGIGVAKANEETFMSIKLKNYIGNQNVVTVSIKGEYTIQNTNLSLVEGNTYAIKSENGLLAIYEDNKLLSTLTSFTAVPKNYGTDHYIFINKRPYLGTMKFDNENNTVVRPVNTIALEDYLKGVVPFEMMASWNKEALKAQAVAARTYADRYKKIEIDDTISYQVYGGYAWNPNSTAAVIETHAQSLMHNGKLIDALYSASNGGITENNFNVWGGTPLAVFPIKVDPYDIKTPWSFDLNKTQINTASLDLSKPQDWWNTVKETDTALTTNIKSWMSLNGYSTYEIKLTSIPELSFSEDKTTGGRVKTASIKLQFFLKDKTTGKFVMDNNTIKDHNLAFTNVNASRIRAMIGINVIKSYLVTQFTEQSTSYSVSGLGNGHAVGMSQWGAKIMADLGFNYQDILSFYYPGATLTNLNTIPVSVQNNTVPVSTPGPPEGITTLPIISNVGSMYTAKTNQIAVDYTINEEVLVTVYVKNAKGTILSYPIKNHKQMSGKQRVVMDVAKIPNGVYTFGVSVINNHKKTSSVIKNITINKSVSTPKVNAVSDSDTMVAGTAVAKATITIKAGSKVIGSGNADSSGKFKLKISKQKAGSMLSITVKDSAGNESKATTVTILDKTAPAKPIVNVITYWDKVVTGTTEAKSTVTIKVGKRVIKTGTADAKGKFKLSIPKQRTGTTVSITSSDAAKNNSSATSIKVKSKR